MEVEGGMIGITRGTPGGKTRGIAYTDAGEVIATNCKINKGSDI